MRNNYPHIYRLVMVSIMLCGISMLANAQTASIDGRIMSTDNVGINSAYIQSVNHKRITTSGADGSFALQNLPVGEHTIVISAIGFKTQTRTLTLKPNDHLIFNIHLQGDTSMINAVSIRLTKESVGLQRLYALEDMAIYAGKKNEIIVLDQVSGNLSANTSRQIFAKVPGMNIQENDGGGIQMSISTRGLNPSRMLEFNVRQNGYDIAADALGYPESYYTPPAFSLEKIEVVRGASSLQYGPQFGGLINFVLKKNALKPLQGEIQATYGSFNFIALNASLGGKKGKFNYYGYVGKRKGDGWRQNTGFDITNGYIHADWQAHKKVNIGLEYTGMLYTMQQPGGLTDIQFKQNPRQSLRDRNWFTASWNIVANTIDYDITPKSRLNIRTFMVAANRYSIGNLHAMTEVDTGGFRNLQKDDYLNFGSEIRYRHIYHLHRGLNSFFIGGVRMYHGNTHRMQGLGSSSSDNNFKFNHPKQLEDSDFKFPSWNMAAFAENVFNINGRFLVTPGFRFEYIQTNSNGYYNDNGVTRNENKNRGRAFILGGLGLSYKVVRNTELYANFSQNYSAVNFNDIRVNNPNLRVDENIRDVKGFNADLGYRGTLRDYLNFDVSAYYLQYNGRIGTITQYDENFQIYQYRTNISNSRNIGVEAYIEMDLIAAIKQTKRFGHLNIYASASYNNARYVNSQNKSLEGKHVELAPDYIIRGGISYKIKGFGISFQYAHTAKQFTDANNTISSANGITGIIPAYSIADLSGSYEYKKLKLSAGCNNLLNATYFTRRASGYPGPGILPSDPRNFYISLGVKL